MYLRRRRLVAGLLLLAVLAMLTIFVGAWARDNAAAIAVAALLAVVAIVWASKAQLLMSQDTAQRWLEARKNNRRTRIRDRFVGFGAVAAAYLCFQFLPLDWFIVVAAPFIGAGSVLGIRLVMAR